MIDDIIDWIMEIPENISEFFSNAFGNLDEFSVYGLIFGIISAGFIFVVRKWMLNPFLVYMSPLSKIIWAGVTYAGCFIAGYFIGKAMES